MSGHSNQKILLVGENIIKGTILENELSTLDVALLTANSGEEAIRIAEKEKPDVITMETDLLTMSGFEVCNQLKKNPKTCDIPVVFVTQMESEEELRRVYSAGGAYYCTSVFPNGKLAKKIRAFLDKSESPTSQRVLIAEDNDAIRSLIAELLKMEGHIVIEARDGLEAWEIIQERKDIDLIISDIKMPRMDGNHLIRLIRENNELEFVPVIIVSAMADKKDIAMLLNAGADDYLIKPFAREEFLARVKAHIRVRKFYGELQEANEKLKNFTESLEKMIATRTEELFDANMESIMMLAVASEYRDTDTGNHVRRINEFTRELTRAMGYSETKANEIGYSSILHDVGKIAVPDFVLKKPGKLTDKEFKLIRTHSVHGEAILSNNLFFKISKEVARSHHEKFNGKGYPDGLVGYEIPLAARITSVSDVFDALTTRRVYKEAWTDDKAYSYILEYSGKDFDPVVVGAFKDLFRQGIISNTMQKYK